MSEDVEDEGVVRFGRAVRLRRQALGMTQEDLALAANCTRYVVTHLETGRFQTRLGTALSIAEAVGLRILDFVEGGSSAIRDVSGPDDHGLDIPEALDDEEDDLDQSPRIL